MKRFCALTALCLFLTVLLLPVRASVTDPEAGDLANSWRYRDGQPIPPSTATVGEEEAYHPDATLLGIDVSHHQGKIDWEAVAASGVDFVILRCGYGMDQTDQDDRYFEYNAAECERLGIPYGVYIYSYATDVERAASEADHVLRLVKGRKLTYPIYYDMEDDSTIGSDLAAIAQTFCGRISAAGYPVGIYANLYWWNELLTDPCFNSWYRWVAHYDTTCGYTGDFQIWQYSTTGSVSGIEGNVDMNFLIGSPEDHGTCALAHTYLETVVPSTCTKDGCTTYTCTICGHSYTESIPAPGHSCESVVTAPTCTTEGYTIKTCTVCGDVTVTDYVSALGHTDADSDGICEICGDEIPVLSLGDINGDGEIDIFDANLAVAYYNETADLSESQLKAADVNGDGETDIFDANLIVAYYNETIHAFPAENQ